MNMSAPVWPRVATAAVNAAPSGKLTLADRGSHCADAKEYGTESDISSLIKDVRIPASKLYDELPHVPLTAS